MSPTVKTGNYQVMPILFINCLEIVVLFCDIICSVIGRTKDLKACKNEKNKFADGLCFDKLVWIFFICCVIGFIVETIWCVIRNGHIESRKSLVYGPFSVAYGMGGVLLTLALYKLKDVHIGKIFLTSFIVGTLAEYIFLGAGNYLWFCCMGLQQCSA